MCACSIVVVVDPKKQILLDLSVIGQNKQEGSETTAKHRVDINVLSEAIAQLAVSFAPGSFACLGSFAPGTLLV
jgi:hypothetical protein